MGVQKGHLGGSKPTQKELFSPVFSLAQTQCTSRSLSGVTHHGDNTLTPFLDPTVVDSELGPHPLLPRTRKCPGSLECDHAHQFAAAAAAKSL